MKIGNGRFDLGLNSHDTRFVPKRLYQTAQMMEREDRKWTATKTDKSREKSLNSEVLEQADRIDVWRSEVLAAEAR